MFGGGLSRHLTLVILEMGTRRRALIGRTLISLRDEAASLERNRTGCNGRVHGFWGVGRGSVDGGPDTSSGAVGPGQAQNNSYLVCQPGPPLLKTSLAAPQGGGCHLAAASSTTSQLSPDA